MAGRVTWAQVDAPTRSGGRVSWASIDAPAVAATTQKGRLTWAQMDAGIGLAPMALGAIGVTATAVAGVSGAAASNGQSTGVDRGKMTWARIDAPWPPPVQYDFNLDPGVSVAATASASVSAGLNIVSDSSKALGAVNVLVQGSSWVSADVQIVVPGGVTPVPVPDVVAGGGPATVIRRETVKTETVREVPQLTQVAVPYTDPSVAMGLADLGFAVQSMAIRLNALESEIASLKSRPEPSIPPQLAFLAPPKAPAKKAQKQITAQAMPAPSSEESDVAFVASVLAAMK